MWWLWDCQSTPIIHLFSHQFVQLPIQCLWINILDWSRKTIHDSGTMRRDTCLNLAPPFSVAYQPAQKWSRTTVHNSMAQAPALAGYGQPKKSPKPIHVVSWCLWQELKANYLTGYWVTEDMTQLFSRYYVCPHILKIDIISAFAGTEYWRRISQPMRPWPGATQESSCYLELFNLIWSDFRRKVSLEVLFWDLLMRWGDHF